MVDLSKYVESVRILMSSTRKLSEAFQKSDARIKRGIADIRSDVEDIERRLVDVEAQVTNARDLSLVMQRKQAPLLPVEPSTTENIIPVLNLPIQTLLEVYTSAPVLLEPFSRPCSVTARTLNGEIDAIEVEASTHGTSWSLETAEAGWLLIPRPGLLERRHQLQSLERLYVVNGTQALPSTLQLLRPAILEPVVAGCRWQLTEKGLLDASADPTRLSIAGQLAKLEERLSALEGAAND
jgi:hypothetical protein